MIPDISELLAFHEDPEHDTGSETLSHLIESIRRHGVGVLLSELPEEWRRALITWLIEAYDNALDGDDFVYINKQFSNELLQEACEQIGRKLRFGPEERTVQSELSAESLASYPRAGVDRSNQRSTDVRREPAPTMQQNGAGRPADMLTQHRNRRRQNRQKGRRSDQNRVADV